MSGVQSHPTATPALLPAGKSQLWEPCGFEPGIRKTEGAAQVAWKLSASTLPEEEAQEKATSAPVTEALSPAEGYKGPRDGALRTARKLGGGKERRMT